MWRRHQYVTCVEIGTVQDQQRAETAEATSHKVIT